MRHPILFIFQTADGLSVNSTDTPKKNLSTQKSSPKKSRHSPSSKDCGKGGSPLPSTPGEHSQRSKPTSQSSGNTSKDTPQGGATPLGSRTDDESEDDDDDDDDSTTSNSDDSSSVVSSEFSLEMKGEHYQTSYVTI